MYDMHMPIVPIISASIIPAISIMYMPVVVDDFSADACGKKRAVFSIFLENSSIDSEVLNLISHMAGRYFFSMLFWPVIHGDIKSCIWEALICETESNLSEFEFIIFFTASVLLVSVTWIVANNSHCLFHLITPVPMDIAIPNDKTDRNVNNDMMIVINIDCSRTSENTVDCLRFIVMRFQYRQIVWTVH